jgi:hypothetical protein
MVMVLPFLRIVRYGTIMDGVKALHIAHLEYSVEDPDRGSGVFFYPWIRDPDPGWGKNPDPDTSRTSQIIFPRA